MTFLGNGALPSLRLFLCKNHGGNSPMSTFSVEKTEITPEKGLAQGPTRACSRGQASDSASAEL